MASKIPVIAKNDGSIKYLIEDKKNGYVFDNPNELPNIIAKIKNNTDEKLKIHL